MSLPRAAVPVLLLVAAAAGWWLWQDGHWRTLVKDLRSDRPVRADDLPATTDQAPVHEALQVRTWRDEHGVVHFEQAGSAPARAATHAVGQAGTLADYERELEAREGISVEDVARARAARERAEAEAAAAAANPEDAVRREQMAGNDAAGTASQQARELMDRYQQALDKIRETNNR